MANNLPNNNSKDEEEPTHLPLKADTSKPFILYLDSLKEVCPVNM